MAMKLIHILGLHVLGLRILGLALVAVVLCFSSSAEAQQARWRAKPAPDEAPSTEAIEEARERFQKALKLYEQEGAVEAALAEIQRAYDVAPSWKLLYNIGQMARTHRDYALALHAYERYLEDGGDEVPADRRAAVEKDIAELKTFVGALDLEVDLGGAKVLIDGQSVGVTPLTEPVVVDAGTVRVEVVKGDTRQARRVTVLGGETKTITIELSVPVEQVAPPPPTPAPPVPDPPEPVPNEMYTPHAWVGWTLTGLFAAGAVATGATALSQSADLSDTSFAGVPTAEMESQRDTVQALAITTDVLGGAAIVTLAVTAIVVLTGAAEVPEEAEAISWSLAPLSFTTLPGDQALGAGLRGDF